MREENKNELCLLHVPHNEVLIKITVRESRSLRARAKSHYVHDGGRLSLGLYSKVFCLLHALPFLYKTYYSLLIIQVSKIKERLS